MKKTFASLLFTFTIYGYSQTETVIDTVSEKELTILDEIVITQKKTLYTQKSDKIVFNVEESMVSQGGNALDALSRAPGIVVSQDGDLSIRGQQGVGVMINGKLTQLSQKELANYLKSIASSNIKQIEVITNPSSKYDATGKAGMINIVLKKSKSDGIKGTLFSNYGRGRKNRTNSGFNLGYNKNKLGLFGSYSYTFRGEEERKKFNQTQYATADRQEISSKNFQTSTTNEPLTSNNFKIGSQYEISSKTNIEISIDAKIGRYQNMANGTNTVFNGFRELEFDALTFNDSKERWNDYTYAVSGIHKFDSIGKNMSFDLDYETSKFRSAQFQSSENINSPGTIGTNDRRGYVPSQLRVFTGKVDFTNPIDQNQTIEWGAKTSIKSNNNPSVYEFFQDGQWIVDANSTNHFKYNENIYAAYTNYKYKKDNLIIQGGIRTEYTDIDIIQKTLKVKHSNNYLKWFPSVSLKYELNNNNSFHTSYSKRINRPSQFDLNPFRFYDDLYNYSQGNPELVPEITHLAEISYNRKNTFMASLYFSKTSNVFTEIYTYTPADNTTVTSQINMDESYSYGLNITNTSEIYKWWSLNTLFNVFETRFTGNSPIATSVDPKITFNLNVQNSFIITDSFKAEANAQYQSKSNVGVYVRDDFFDFSVGISRQVFSNKGSIKLSIIDIFNTNKYNITSNIGITDINKKYNLDSRVVTIGITYLL